MGVVSHSVLLQAKTPPSYPTCAHQASYLHSNSLAIAILLFFFLWLQPKPQHKHTYNQVFLRIFKASAVSFSFKLAQQNFQVLSSWAGAAWSVHIHCPAHPDELQLPLSRWQLDRRRDRSHICVNTQRDYLGPAGKQDNVEGKRQNPAVKNSNH